MRNADAARYARWAATVSILIVTLTASVYIHRAWRASHTGGETPEPIPDSVQQRSAVFSHSKVESSKTIYTIRASQATEFKEHSLLQDVWITIYGKEGARNDNVHTRECSYEPNSGNIRCQGAVQIDLESADQAKEPGHPHVMHVKTQDFSFDEKTGDARSEQPVEIQFPGGSGHGRGLSYNANRTDLRLEHDVEFQMGSPTDPKAPVTTFAGSALDFERSISTARLFGPVRVTQSGRVLTSGLLTLLLDSEMHARHLRASNHPELRSGDLPGTATAPTGSIEVSSDEMDAELDPEGWAQQAEFSGNVRAHRRSAKENSNFTAQQAVLLMEPRDNLLRSVNANGAVHVDMHSDTPSGPQSRTLDTAALRLDFHSTPGPDPRSQISAAETLAPGAITLNSPGDSTQVHAAKFNAHFDAAGRFNWLEGHSGTEIDRQIKSDPPQKIAARDLAVNFANDGGWTNLKLDRNVRFHQAERTAECDRATIAHATEIIHLDGSPAVADASARTTAGAIEINQSTNDIHAESSVITTYRNSIPDQGPTIGAGIAHISADTLAGNGASGHLLYSGHARYWQGDTALNAEVIEITRAQNRIDARGNVIAALPQLPGPGMPGTTAGAKAKPARPVIWDVRAPVLHYWNDTGKGLLEGGVNATSTQGRLHSETLDLFLAPAAPPDSIGQPPPAAAVITAAPKAAPTASQGRQLERAVARGSVVVQQGERRGMADQGVYTAADGRYVLSGGDPTIIDAASDTTTQGHSLTFYVASDTILIDAQAGSKTLTKHRVEK